MSLTEQEKDDLLDWAESIMCNSLPMPHCSPAEWDRIITKWRDKKHGVMSTIIDEKLTGFC